MEPSFEITTSIYEDAAQQTIRVIPGEESWLIVIDGVTIGTIVNTGDDNWRWKDGGRDNEVAQRIGLCIENYYM